MVRILTILLFLNIACQSNEEKKAEVNTKPSETVNNKPAPEKKEISGSALPKTDTIIYLEDRSEKVQIDIRYPEQGVPNKGTLLVLHGWNLPHLDWCEKTDLCSKALAEGYTLILPNLRKSTYSWELYPETIEKYREYPTRKWLVETAFVYLQQEFGLLKSNDSNFVVGLSTGARGAMLLALEHPSIFKGTASLSGDFDQTKLPNDPIYIGFYGKIENHKDRWEGKDNIQLRISEFNVPVYLGHGELDEVCPVEQTQTYFEALKLEKPELEMVCNIAPKAKHDYDYWNSEVENVLQFFNSLK